jgi:hypothetical protein
MIPMKRILSITLAGALVATSGVPIAAPANAHTSTRYHTHHYKGQTHYAHRYCRRSSATTGTVVGGVAGAVAAPGIIGHGVLGVVGGAVGGAVAGGAIDRSMTAHRRCYWR